jgi:hypothetical protein
MVMYTLRYGLLLSLVLVSSAMHAQEPALRPDVRQELWLSAGVQGRAPKFLKDPLGDHYKRIRLSGQLGYRSADNFFAGRQLYSDVAVRYKLTDWLSVASEYRYAVRVGSANRQRIGFQARAGHKVGRFDLDYRFTWQRNYLERDRQRTLLRNRFGVGYNIRKWKLDPEFSVEFFTRTDRGDGWFLLGTRYKLGTDWELAKGHTIGPNLIYDRDGRVNAPVNRIIFSIDYGINLRKA